MHKFKYCLLVAAAILFAAKVYAAPAEPVPGAQVYIVHEPDDQAIANCVTDSAGEFHFAVTDKKVPQQGVFKMMVSSPDQNKYKTEPQVIEVSYDLRGGTKFSYVLTWTPPNKGQTKGAFAISGKSAT